MSSLRALDRGRRARAYALVTLVLVLSVAASILLGPAELGAGRMWRVLLELRMARTLVAIGAGASLAVAGVLVQGLFRNPLASPSIVGATAGASLGGQVALVLTALALGGLGSWIRPEMFLPLGCVLGALVALVILLAVHRVKPDLIVMLLVGFALSSLFLSLGSLLVSVAQESWELGRALIGFSLGHIGGVGWPQVRLLLPFVGFGLGAAWYWSGPLDLMLTGEEEARTLGLDVAQLRFWVVVWAALLTAGAVAVGGNIAFVGLVVPHALRPWVGVSHRALIPAAALGGSSFVLAADVLARNLSDHGELPLGVITGLVGAPLFLLLLIRAKGESFGR